MMFRYGYGTDAGYDIYRKTKYGTYV
jgi:hypothetical protein